jgi:hypothetical protein
MKVNSSAPRVLATCQQVFAEHRPLLFSTLKLAAIHFFHAKQNRE